MGGWRERERNGKTGIEFCEEERGQILDKKFCLRSLRGASREPCIQARRKRNQRLMRFRKGPSPGHSLPPILP